MKISRVGIKFSAVVFLLILLVIFFLASMVLKQREKSFMKEMEIRTRFFGRTAQESLFPEKNPFQMHFAVHEMMKEKGILYAGVFDETGKFLSHSESARVGKKAGAGTDRKINALENFAVQQYKKDDQLYYKLILPLKVSDKKIGGVLIGFSKNSMGRALAAVREKIIKIALLVLSSGVILTMIIVRFMVKPIDNLAEAAGEIGEGNLDVRVKEKGKDEIGDLSRTFNEMVKGLGEREFLRETFGKYVNPEVARQALSKKLKLGGERKAVSVLLTDIRGFTRITEKIPPEKIVNLLNRYFNIIVDIVFDQDGTVDKFMGDAMLAVFGAPAYIENHPYKAAAAAWKIKQAVAKFNRESEIPLNTGIALHSGDVIAGNIGSSKKMEYTVMGDTVNTVSRIESLNKKFGTDILMSDSIFERISPDIKVEEVTTVKLRGKEKEHTIYRLKGMPE